MTQHVNPLALPQGVQIVGPLQSGDAQILSAPAMEFVAALVREHSPRRQALLQRRLEVQKQFDAGIRPDFLPETAHVRQGDWTVAPLPDDLLDRRVEITGPVDRKMVINALNSGARVFMADLEDSNAPSWRNCVDGQINLRDAVAGTSEYQHPTRDKLYKLNPQTATLMVRPRGWHLDETHVLIDGQPAPASLVDFGLFFFHNARPLLAKGSGPYFYLPKLENHLEARLWNDVFVQAQRMLDIPKGTIKATVLIETITASFEMDEILYELRDHSAGLNCGRWDYIFSFIKKLRDDPKAVMPDRGQVGMTQPFMEAYTSLVIKTCHKRRVHAMGGMAAQIPIKNDPEANNAAFAKVRADKEREATAGHDGTWVAHPGLVSLAIEIFDTHMPGDNQIERQRDDVHVTAEDLLAVPAGTRSIDGLRHNIRVGVQYIEAWLRGNGCVPLSNLMEDAATAEISRSQVWQWLRHGALLDGQPLTTELMRQTLQEEMQGLRDTLGEERFEKGRFKQAADLFDALCTEANFTEFLTLPAYKLLTDNA